MVLRVDVVDAALEAAYGEQRDGVRIVAARAGGSPARRRAGQRARRRAAIWRCSAGATRASTTASADIWPTMRSRSDRTWSRAAKLAAMVIADAVLRKLPGALGHAESVIEESFSEALGGAVRVPALHPSGELPRLGGARGAAVR